MPDFAAKYVDEFDENGIEHEGNENMLQLMQMNITREEVRAFMIQRHSLERHGQTEFIDFGRAAADGRGG